MQMFSMLRTIEDQYLGVADKFTANVQQWINNNPSRVAAGEKCPLVIKGLPQFYTDVDGPTPFLVEIIEKLRELGFVEPGRIFSQLGFNQYGNHAIVWPQVMLDYDSQNEAEAESDLSSSFHAYGQFSSIKSEML